jgi:hypothetical protein
MKTLVRRALLVFAFTFALAPYGLAAMGAIVPAYFYPAGQGLTYWNQMNSAALRIPLIAILNPANGPGTVQDPNYAAAVNRLRASGGRVLGYISTAYTARSPQNVKADIDAYYAFYRVDGIFVDEMTNDDTSAHLNYYEDLCNYIHAKAKGSLVFGNPGTNTFELYLSYKAADDLIIFESKSSAYLGFQPSTWVQFYPATHFGNIVYAVPTPANMGLFVAKAKLQNAGWVFMTDATLPNPYDRLPSYWPFEVEAIAVANAINPYTSSE